MSTPTIKELLSYENTFVKERYTNDYPNARLSADEAFEELLKYFWLIAKHHDERKKNPNSNDLDFECEMHSEMLEIDLMWHIFILFTKDYHDFCLKYFSTFIHHTPTMKSNPKSESKQVESLERYLNYIYTHLGQETLCKWFQQA